MKRMSLFVLSLILVALLLTACAGAGAQNEDDTNDIDTYEGMEVEVVLVENIKNDDRSLLDITVKNSSDQSFSGSVITRGWFQKWDIDIENLPSGKEITRRVVGGYIKHPEDGYRYEFDGEFTDKVYTSEIDYELFEIEDAPNSYNVRMNEINKENVFEVMKEIYSEYGSNIVHVGFFDNDVDLENYDYSVEPKAEYYGIPENEKRIIINFDEEFEFKP